MSGPKTREKGPISHNAFFAKVRHTAWDARYIISVPLAVISNSAIKKDSTACPPPHTRALCHETEPSVPVLGMPLVRVRIVLGESLLGEPTRPYAPTATVQAVVDQALEPHQGVELDESVEVFKDAEQN